MRDFTVGVAGTIASFGLAEAHLVFGILAGAATTVYMVISIHRELKK